MVLGWGKTTQKLIQAWQNVPCPWGSRSTDHQPQKQTSCSEPEAAHVVPCPLLPQWIRKTGTRDRAISKRRKCVGFWNLAGSGQIAWRLREYRTFDQWGSKSYREVVFPTAGGEDRWTLLPRNTGLEAQPLSRTRSPCLFIPRSIKLPVCFPNKDKHLLGPRPLALRQLPEPKQCHQALDKAAHSDLREAGQSQSLHLCIMLCQARKDLR